MSEKTITHKDLAEKLGVSETTVKSYRRKFSGCFPVASKGKPIRFKPEAEKIAFRIRDLFAAGMSVEEVRERLAEEFKWFTPKDSSSAKHKDDRLKNDIPHNFATAVSNMAKSMITLSQQQTAILENMQRIENMLLEFDPGVFKNIDPGVSQRSGQEIIRELSALKVEMRSIAQNFTNSNSIMAEEHSAFMSGMKHLADALAVNEGLVQDNGRKKADILTFDKPESVSFHEHTEKKPIQTVPHPEFPRHILSMPLVVRNDEGAYFSAGGKSISRISLNDIKAILAQTYMPPENFSMFWEYDVDGWWIYFSQRGIPAPMESANIGIQVYEITSARGVSVLEARKYSYNGEIRHTTEMVQFVTGVGKE